MPGIYYNNNALNNEASENFLVTTGDAGGDRTLTIRNTDNTNPASAAHLEVTTGGAVAGDPYLFCSVTGVTDFALGIDNSDGDNFKITTGASPSAGTEIFQIEKATGAISFNGAYEFPITDGTVNQVLKTDGAGNIDWVAFGSLLTDISKTYFVGKHGNDANNGKTPNNAKLTIQAAVTAAVAGDTVIVYPGTYTETITHAANDVSVFAMGDSTNCIIRQANANVINFNTRTNIVYKFFRIETTGATTAINTIQGSTGSCTFNDCYLRCVSAAAIVAAAQPSVAALTGAGSIYISLGAIDYFHTGACGGTAVKSACIVADGGLIETRRNSDINITCSGTALVTGYAVDLAATGNVNIYNSKIDVTDPDATLVVGLGYLGGTGTTHEYFRNNVHVIAGAANAGYGFYAGDTVSVSRFFYNHIHVTDAGGSSYSFYVGATATVISHYDDIIAADGVNLVATGVFTSVNSPIDGNLTLTSPKAAATELLTIANTDNTATASSAALNISVGGATSTGDPYANFLVTGAETYSLGIDNSDGDKLKLTTGATPSAGSSVMAFTGTTAIDLGTDANAKTITIGNVTGATAVEVKCGTGNIIATSGAGTILDIRSTGSITMPLTPAFNANSGAKSNVTGDGTVYTILFDNEVFDQRANYDPATGIFTAPRTGRYLFTAAVDMGGLDVAHTLGNFSIVIAGTSAKTYRSLFNPFGMATPGVNLTISLSVLCDMTITDTAYCTITITGGTKVVDLNAGYSFFAGKLEC